MDNNRYTQKSRGQIRPQPRTTLAKVIVTRRMPQTPTVVKEYISKYSVITPVFAPSIYSSFKSKDNKPVSSVKPKSHRIEKSLARTTNKTMLLSRVVESNKTNPRKKNWTKSLTLHRVMLSLFLVALIGTTGYISIDTWHTNVQAKQFLAKSKAPTQSDVLANSAKDKESDQPATSQGAETSVASTFDSYKVAPDLPRAIYINKINVSGKILPMGVNTDNSLQAPTNINDAGWYASSAKPGQDGAMLIDGHASETGTHYGLFGYLVDIKAGDQIVIERGDGVRFSYNVVHTEIKPLEGLDMSKLLVPYDNAKQGVNLIACAGNWTSNKSTLDHRLIVFAILQ